MNIEYPLKAAYSLKIESVVKNLSTERHEGLSKAEASKRSKRFGLNINKSQKQKSLWSMAFEQFNSPIVYLLLLTGFASLYFKNIVEAIAIYIVILVNAMIGFFMELQARSSMRALREMDVSYSRVIRGGKTIEISSDGLTPGDLLLLEAGDVVSGDGRIVSINGLQVDESALTGESFPVLKTNKTLTEKIEPLAAENMVYKGTAIMNGNARVIITGIAENTELGKISELVGRSASTKTPLDIKISKLTKKLIWITLIMTGIFAFSGIIEGKPWLQILETSIALAVAAFPEGLPIVATVALAYGMLLMARKNAIVKKLSSVETLGGVNVILTDKTGTLTENKIFVEVLSFPSLELNVSIKNGSLEYKETGIEKCQENLELLVRIGSLCNNAPLHQADKDKKSSGDPIEIALLVLADATGFPAKKTAGEFKRLAEIPFSSETKLMGTLHQASTGFFVSAKGSVEDLLLKCKTLKFGTTARDLSKEEREKILSRAEALSSSGLRVLAFAYRIFTEMPAGDYLLDLVYVGMVGFLDPPRMDIKGAISACHSAGIKIVMITGDHPMTALNIAKKVGITAMDDNKVIAGSELPEMEVLGDEWTKRVLSTSVFARTTPKQKLEIVEVYQKAGFIVAMTGDGVNDAPALKKADIGIAMGLRGTQVAKETASIVLKDDSFTSISQAVAHGREIFQNIQRFVIYLVSCNLSEIFIVTILGFLANVAMLFPLQILFLNMVTDVFPALALGLGKGDATVMQRPPRDPKLDIISNYNWLVILIYALMMTGSVLLAIFLCKIYVTTDVKVLNNVAFLTLAASQLFHVFNMSSAHSRILVNEVTKNKFVWIALLLCFVLLAAVYSFRQSREALNLYLIPLQAMFIIGFASMLPLFFVQFYKLVLEKRAVPGN
ncbi:cation-translocating P-type ATPase [Pedobacter jejuensis]|uniref:Cation-translocating P-type ATPase n=1 Tax=Pedobacter jejuensis TaxID=1268550 RepID=A0A3N0C1F0_9SPHI|nr:cation-translocating P-type ATPase [Pedobacter jejuensis]RNL56039.1 cation-translocating P-type ATPase [Pedobacter jejuensis]